MRSMICGCAAVRSSRSATSAARGGDLPGTLGIAAGARTCGSASIRTSFGKQQVHDVTRVAIRP